MAVFSFRKSVGLSIYIALCYYALIIGDISTGRKCYQTLNKLRKEPAKFEILIDKGIIEQLDFKNNSSSSPTILKCGSLKFSPRSPCMPLIILPGFVVFLMVLAASRYIHNSFSRGIFFLFSFITLCTVVNGTQKYLLGLGWWPSLKVFTTSCFYGALFWSIDNFSTTNFDDILENIQGDMNKTQILYDYTKFCWKIISTFFLAICITLAWKITGDYHEQCYEDTGIANIITNNTIWLVFWGSVGLLGINGFEAHRRIWAVIKKLKNNTEPDE